MASLDDIFSGVPAAPQAAAPVAAPKQSLDDIFGAPTPPAVAPDSSALGTVINRAGEYVPAVSRATGGAINTAKRELYQRDAEIDYETGMPIATRALVHRADNPDEAKLALEKTYGPGNYGQDPWGRWWVQQNGKKTAVFPRTWSGIPGNVAAGLMGTTPAQAGAVAGALAGEVAFPAGGGIPGAMVGAAGGKLLDDAIKYGQGMFSKSAPETVSGALNEGSLAGAFQGAVPVARVVGNAIKPGIQRWLGATPASQAMGRDMLLEGVSPPVGSVAPEATSLEYKRGLRNILSGDPKEAGRLGYVDQRMRDMLEQNGVPTAEVAPMMEAIYDRSARVSSGDAGRLLTSRAQSLSSGLTQDAADATRAAEEALRNVDNSLRAIARPSPQLADDVAGAIKNERSAFGQQMREGYKAVDRIAGQQPIVPTEGVQRAAADLVDVMPPEAVPPIIRRLAQGNGGPMTFEEAHNLRTTLRDMGDTQGVTPAGIRIGNVRRLTSAVDSAIQNSQGALGQEAAAALRQIDQAYAKGIAKFNDATVNKLVKDVRSGQPAEPAYVANTVMDPQQITTAKTVVGMLPQPARNGVVQADLQNLIEGASYLRPDGTRMMDGKTLMEMLEARRPLMEAVYPQADGGAKILSSLRAYARDLAVYDGKIDVSRVANPTQVTDLLQKAAGASRAADDFAKKNPLGALASNDPKVADRAASFLIMPGREETTMQAARTLGPTSPEWQSVQRYAIQKLFSDAVIETPALGKTLSGGSVVTELGKYTKKQQELLFPNGLADDMRLLAKEIRYLFPAAPGDIHQSQVAGSIKNGLSPFNVWAAYKYGRSLVSGWIADHPKVLNYLASEVRRDPVQARSTMSVLRQWILNSQTQGPGKKPPTGEALPPKETDKKRPLYSSE